MSNAFVKTILAFLRRLSMLLLAGISTYLAGAWPDLLVKAVKETPGAVATLPVVLLVIEFIQKYLREKKAEQKAAF